MSLYDLATAVNGKESFVRFVHALAADAERFDAEGSRTADGKLNLSSGGWENGSVAAFLEAMAAWVEADSERAGGSRVPEQAAWQTFAMILLAGKAYE